MVGCHPVSVPSHRFVLVLGLLLGCAGGSQSSAPATSAASEASAQGLRLASTRWPPFTDQAGEPALALELVSAALRRAGYASNTDIVPDGELTEALRQGRYDGSAALWRSADREEFLLYSDAYLENRLVLIGHKDSVVEVGSLAELAGKRVGLVVGYAYGPDIEGASAPVFVRGASTDQNLRDLLDGKLDYALIDALVAHYLVQQYPQQSAQHFAIGETPVSTRTLHLGLRKDLPHAAAAIEAFNRELAQMRSDGTYNEVLQLRWIRADIDGDGTAELVAGGERVGTAPPATSYELLAPQPSSADAPAKQAPARFVVRGVPYDTWDAVPETYRREPEPDSLSEKPRTLRVSLFEF